MTWLAAAFWARMGWELAAAAILVFMLVGVVVGVALWVLIGALLAAGCKHTSYHETSGCDAICNKCGKNLGFIGKLRT